MILTKEQKENCKKIADLMKYYNLTFPWAKSEEGFEHWNEVWNKFKHYANREEKKVCSECGREL